MVGALDEQAKEDLELLYEDIDDGNKAKKEFFWCVLGCVGCEEEFKRYLNK